MKETSFGTLEYGRLFTTTSASFSTPSTILFLYSLSGISYACAASPSISIGGRSPDNMIIGPGSVEGGSVEVLRSSISGYKA